MLPQTARLTKDQDLYRVRRYGRQISNVHVSIRVLTTKNPHTRIAFVVSKKVSRLATIRNQTKRRLRAIIIKKYKQVKKNRDIIIIAKPNSNKATFEELNKTTQKLLNQAKLLE